MRLVLSLAGFAGRLSAGVRCHYMWMLIRLGLPVKPWKSRPSEPQLRVFDGE